MIRLAILIGSFLVTFGTLAAVFMFSAGPLARTTPTPMPSHTPYYTLAATPRPGADTPAPTPAPSDATSIPTMASPAAPVPTAAPLFNPFASGTPVPLRTGLPSFSLPTGAPAERQTYLVAGAAFVDSQVPNDGNIVQSGDGVIISTSGTSHDALWVTYKLDPSLLPVGMTIESVDALICGQGQGQFYEVYGPVGSDPTEYEVAAPASDGCWHFTGAPGNDLSVIASTMLDSTLYIDHVQYTVNFAN